MTMNRVLILGQGGREHVIAYKLKNEGIDVYCYPGNPGIMNEAKETHLKSSDFNEIKDFCLNKRIDLVVVGPEKYLNDGITDYLNQYGINVFGPSKNAARIETDKSYAKKIMKSNNIETAKAVFAENEQMFKDIIKTRKYPYVIKVSGLAAGKGAYVITNRSEYEDAYNDIYSKNKFKQAANRVIIEDFLEGEESSLFVITDGKNAVPLLPAQDYKRAYDEDKGQNTGGMGAYTPFIGINENKLSTIMETIIFPVLRGMERDGNPFKGLLYAGLMLDGNKTSIVEFNARFGDPETQSILFLMESPIYDIMKKSVKGNLKNVCCKFSSGYAVTVIMAANGYPSSYNKGMNIDLNNRIDENSYIFHAGTIMKNNRLVSNGGRILSVTSRDNTLEQAVNRVYNNIRKINIENVFYRNDIAKKGIK